jgi:hypothetical protein
MSQYYPQAAVILRATWENFGLNLQQQKEINGYLQQGGQISLGKPLPPVTPDPTSDMPILCERLTVNINDYTTADTFSCEVDYKNFPLDPRNLKALGISIYMQDMKEIFRPPPDNGLHKIQPSQSNVVFEGFVDTDTINFDETNRVVKFEGRDLTALFLDSSWNLGPVPLSTPLDVLYQQIIGSLRNTASIKISNISGVNPLPTLGLLSPEFGSLANLKNAKKDETYWEVMQDLAARAGLIIYMNIDTLVITKPRNLYTTDPAKIVHFIFGKNIKTLEFKRKLGRLKGFNVIVRSFNDKVTNSAKIPEEATADWAASIGLPAKRVQIPQFDAQGGPLAPQDAPFFSFRVPNLQNKDALIAIGEKVFEEISRQQLDGRFTTREMLAPTDQLGTTFDMTKLNIGTPIKIEIDQGDLAGLARLSSVGAKTQYLKARGYSPVIAKIFAETMGKFHTIFYTKSFEISFDRDNAWDLKVDFVNFIENISVVLGGTGTNAPTT